MPRIKIPGSDWDMSDWEPEDVVVDAIVMAVKGCGDDDDPVAVIGSEGQMFRILGVRRAPSGGGVQIVVEAVTE